METALRFLRLLLYLSTQIGVISESQLSTKTVKTPKANTISIHIVVVNTQYIYNSHLRLMCLSKLLTPSTSITFTNAITSRIHHRNLTTMKFQNRFSALCLLRFSVNFERLKNSVVFCGADFLLFFHHANQTFSLLCKKRPKSSLSGADC